MQPTFAPGMAVQAGKFGHTFWSNPLYGETVWDNDVQPEGVAVSYDGRYDGAFERASLTAARYAILEHGEGSNVYLVAAQAAAHAVVGRFWRPSIAIGYYGYDNLMPQGASALALRNRGNIMFEEAGQRRFLSSFRIINPIAALVFDPGGFQVIATGEYIRNLGANTALDDFLLRTNHRSHLAGVSWQATDNVGIYFNSLISKRLRACSLTGEPPAYQPRYRLDFALSF